MALPPRHHAGASGSDMSQPDPKWVALGYAPYELARHWDIPNLIAERIVWGILQGGEALVRGRDRGALRTISKEIGATLSLGPLTWGWFDDVEIEWHDLLKHGRNLVPCEYEDRVSAAAARSANDREPTPTAAAETKMKLWLRQQADDPPGRKADIFAWAKTGELIGEEGKALGRRSFSRAWHEAAPSSWKLPGPRTKFLRLSDIKSRSN
jgi:hypothetical protein